MKLRALLGLLLLTPVLHAASISVPFDGNLRASNGYQPHTAFKPEFSSFGKRKVFHLLPGQILIYDAPKLKSLRFSYKLDTLPADSALPILSFTNADNSRRLSLMFRRRSLILAVNDSYLRTAQNVLTPGRWYRISVYWNAEPQLLVDGKTLQLHVMDGPVKKVDFPKAGTLQIGPSFASRIMDLEFGESISDEPPPIALSSIVWEAREFPHFAGIQIRDQTTGSKFAWTTDSTFAEESLTLPAPGPYVLTWRIKRIAASPQGVLVSNVYHQNRLLASVKKNASDVKNGGYEDFMLAFEASNSGSVRAVLHSFIPIKHSIYADSISIKNANTGWEAHHQIEDLHRTMGMVKDDSLAEKGKAVDNENTLTYGPYICIGQPGKYRASWRLKISSKLPDRLPILLLNVYAHDGFLGPQRRGNKSYAELPLNTSSFSKRDAWEVKSLEFEYDGSDMLEFRTFTRVFEAGDIVIDTIAVELLKEN